MYSLVTIVAGGVAIVAEVLAIITACIVIDKKKGNQVSVIQANKPPPYVAIDNCSMARLSRLSSEMLPNDLDAKKCWRFTLFKIPTRVLPAVSASVLAVTEKSIVSDKMHPRTTDYSEEEDFAKYVKVKVSRTLLVILGPPTHKLCDSSSVHVDPDRSWHVDFQRVTEIAEGKGSRPRNQQCTSSLDCPVRFCCRDDSGNLINGEAWRSYPEPIAEGEDQVGPMRRVLIDVVVEKEGEHSCMLHVLSDGPWRLLFPTTCWGAKEAARDIAKWDKCRQEQNCQFPPVASPGR
ncbi:hypothetical protein DPMN_193798 [Dreissena polymorpha]|uniref:Uncharacterized protein n=1 Tax=Dreissena polymorpha TaxID=45954 RepID=A0A9D3Y6F9_DREPO|nr:hypothetical protein DPMN_193798 [Dreissena polymorpha]